MSSPKPPSLVPSSTTDRAGSSAPRDFTDDNPFGRRRSATRTWAEFALNHVGDYIRRRAFRKGRTFSRGMKATR